MPDPQPARRPPEPASGSGCPLVVDLIQFALGQGGADERRKIETHANQCSPCRRWIARAGQMAASNQAAAATKTSPAGNPTWQRLAFEDLQRRLRQLAEEMK